MIKNKPKLDDATYDKLKKELLDFEKKIKYQKNKKSIKFSRILNHQKNLKKLNIQNQCYH